MKKSISICLIIIMIFSTVFLSGCGENKIIDGNEYTTYGFLNSDNNKNPNIKYEISIGNIIWSCLLVETIVAPVYFLGFSLYNPVCKKINKNNKNNGIIKRFN